MQACPTLIPPERPAFVPWPGPTRTETVVAHRLMAASDPRPTVHAPRYEGVPIPAGWREEACVDCEDLVVTVAGHPEHATRCPECASAHNREAANARSVVQKDLQKRRQRAA